MQNEDNPIDDSNKINWIDDSNIQSRPIPEHKIPMLPYPVISEPRVRQEQTYSDYKPQSWPVSLSHQSTSLGSIPLAQRSNRRKTEEDEEDKRRRIPRRSKLSTKNPLHTTKSSTVIIEGSSLTNKYSSSEAEIDIDFTYCPKNNR